jgi:hypothetical protein
MPAEDRESQIDGLVNGPSRGQLKELTGAPIEMLKAPVNSVSEKNQRMYSPGRSASAASW